MKDVKTILLEGKTESGKTRGILFDEVEKMIAKEENLLILDSKAEYYNNFYKALKDKDYQILLINLADAKKSHGYNPLTLPLYYYKNGDIDKAISLIQMIGDEIFKEENPSIDPYWTNSAASLFVGLALLLFQKAPTNTINLGSVSVAIDAMNHKDNVINKYLKEIDVIDPVYVSLSSIAFAPTDTKDSILSVASQKLKLYILKQDLLNMLSTTDFEIENFGQKKTALFIVTRPGHNVNTIADILIEQILEVTCDHKTKLNVVLDNIETIPSINSLKQFLDMLLPNIKIIIATRNENNLKEMYPDRTFANILEKVNVEDMEKCIAKDACDIKESIEYPENNYKIEVFDIEKNLQ